MKRLVCRSSISIHNAGAPRELDANFRFDLCHLGLTFTTPTGTAEKPTKILLQSRKFT